MIAPDSNMDRSPAEWSTMAGILCCKHQDLIQILSIGPVGATPTKQ